MILKLKELLKQKGISGKDLANKVGVSENSISFISTGKTQPRFDLLVKIAEVLDVDIKDLFNSTKEYQTETIYVNREGKFIPIGELKK
jgi:transcriptional regulator with XRE-family HTH domain